MSARTPAQRTAWDKFQLDTFGQRVRCFVRSVPPARRAEIARRPRFRNQPYLRRADEPGFGDPLP